MPGVRGVVERVDAQVEGDGAAQRDREGRCLDIPVARIGDDDRVGGQQLAIRAQKVREGARTPLLLALDEERDAELEVAALGLMCGDERADRADVGHHTRLVVGRTAPEEPVAAFGRLERRGLPFLVLPRGLNVVVRVEQHGGPTVLRLAPGDDRRVPEIGAVGERGAAHASTTSKTPVSRSRPAISSALATTCAGSKAGHDTEGYARAV